MLDFVNGPEMAKNHHQELHREADHRRLVKQALAAKSVQVTQPKLVAESVGRQMIRLGWRIAGSKSGTLVVNEGSGSHELWVVDVPC